MKPTIVHEKTAATLASLDAFLRDGGIEHFSAAEITRLRKVRKETYAIPHQNWWPRIVPALQVAEMLRAIMGRPIAVGNGYRPKDYNRAVGGARRSQHVQFRALDLDLIDASPTDKERFREAAATLYLDPSVGVALKMGLGLYHPNGRARVHVDCGHRRRHWKKKHTAPLLESLR